ncbi:MAG: response regulator [Planctomycetota bacterium]|nr:MAG: response regulator [Planctomycetota bacterium]
MSHILVIEADLAELRIIQSRIANLGHDVVCAETGAAGIVEARTNDVDLILLAANLGAGVEGTEVCRRLKAIPRLVSVPILMYCRTNCSTELCDRAYDAGCEAFLTKTQVPAIERVISVMMRIKARNDEVAEQNRALENENRRLEEESRALADMERQLGRPNVAAAVGAGRPDGVLVVDGQGQVRQADRGACELLGGQLEGRSLGTLAPNSGLEAFVRDARNEPRDGFRFDLPGRGGRQGRALLASVMPVTTRDTAIECGRRVVLLLDVGKRKLSDEMLGGLEPAVTRQQLGALLEAARTIFRPSSFIGTTDDAVSTRKQIIALNNRPGPVLIRGERGAGKEFVARIIHYNGNATGSFLQIRVGALTPGSLDKELFGYFKGAFEGAVADRPGLVLLSNDGTLFLSEIGDLPHELQVKLLEVLEQGTVQRMGKRRRERVDVRIVASTSRDLRVLAREGKFLPALLAKLSTNVLDVAPLRARIADVAPLVDSFLARFGSRFEVESIERDALWVMAQYDWPGNVAELEDCIEQACRRAEQGLVRIEHLTRPLRDLHAELPAQDLIPALRPTALCATDPGSNGSQARVLSETRPAADRLEVQSWTITQDDPISFDVYEKKALLRALDCCGGDKLATARLLNVGKSTLYRKLKRFGIS